LGRTNPSRNNVLRFSPFGVLFEKFDGIADGQDRFGGIVRNFAAEFLLESHHEFDGVETIGAKIVDETRLLRHLVGFDPQVFHDDLFNPLANITHRSNLVLLDWAAAGTGSQPSRNGLVADFPARASVAMKTPAPPQAVPKCPHLLRPDNTLVIEIIHRE